MGKVVITTEETVTNQQINSIVIDKSKFDIDFVYYSMVILGQLLNYHSKTSTAVPIVNKSTFSQYEILCPSLDEQKQIASILSEIDNKIQLNTAINENLEQQAQAIFTDLITDIQERVSFTSVIQVLGGGTPKTGKQEYWNGEIPFFTPKDDGISGTTFDREGFQNMISNIEAGKIGTVIVKDMSRFGRDYLKVGYYTEVMFAEYDIHFIAINDGVDSEREDNDFTPIRNLFNEFYAKDTSKKIRAVWKAKGSAGERIAAVPVYGYKKDPNDPKHLIIDEEAAPIVRRIYDMCLSGMGPAQIAKQLSEEKILRPSYHMNNIGMSHRTDLGKNPYGWRCTGVAAILERRDYLGHTTNFKYKRKSYKCHKAVKRPEEEHMIFYNTHEAIISQEDWDAVQKIREGRRRKNKTGAVSKFAGLIYCADCGARLYYHGKPNNNQSHFQCGTYSYTATKGECSSHYISEKVIEQIVLTELNKIINAAEIDVNALSSAIMQYCSDISQKAVSKRKKELSAAQKRYDELDRLFNKIYEDNANGKISDERFEKMANGYEAEQEKLKLTITELSSTFTKYQEQSDNGKRFLNIVKRYTQLTELTTEILHEFIDKILVYAPDKSSGRRVVRVDIYYNFVGAIDTSSLAA